jgi:hypothetical protein
MSAASKSFTRLLAIADTVSGVKARENPQDTIAHYERLVYQLWLPPEVRSLADETFDTVKRGRTAWASLSGAYGFGKTAATITLWDYARTKEFLAIPPLSCTNFDELAHGIAALAGAQLPKAQKKIRALFKEVWTEGLDAVARTDAKHYELSSKQLRHLFEDKLNAGQLTLDNQCYRLVEFLSRLGEMATHWSNGLIVVLDELQQLLGPLDVRAIVKFREFVWGMRTERSHCGVVLALDSLLEARLARWATDVLHRIRDQGPSLQMSYIYTREFPRWLWDKLSSQNGSGTPLVALQALTDDVLVSLGQFVERPDLSNGPRTVVDVFSNAQMHYQESGESYDIPDLVDDISHGRFRYFGEGAPVQNVLAQLFKDEWLVEDEARFNMVQTLAAFPLGCPQETLQKYIPSKRSRERARSELFGPLLVELSSGLALEKLQQVRRSSMDWEQLLARCWETLPALDALGAHAPNMILRVLIPVLFPRGNPANPTWEKLSDDSTSILTGWHLFRGSFHESFPQREIALCVTDEEPRSWRRDVDLCIAFVCNSKLDVAPATVFHEKAETPCITLQLPVLKPLDGILPSDLARCHKYIQPEPFRPATILTAIHDLEAFLGSLLEGEQDTISSDADGQKGRRHARAFVKVAVDFVIRELLQGMVDLGNKRSIKQRGPELLHALFTISCRRRFPDYETFIKAPKWQEILGTYRDGIRNDKLSLAQRQGRENITAPKAELLDILFKQKSTAAGDSYLRLLGPLVEATGTPDVFSIRLSLHPAEVALLTYLKGTKSKRRIPFIAAEEFLRHQGYIELEAKEVVKLLVDRELITAGESQYIEVVQNSDVTRAALINRITEVHRELGLLGAELATDELLEDLSLLKLQKRLDDLDKQLKLRLAHQVDEIESNVGKIRQMIGTVTAISIEGEWLASDISQHLVSIAGVLQRNKEELAKGLRKELQRAEAGLKEATRDSTQWTKLWRRRRAALIASRQKLEERVTLFTERARAFARWAPLNHQLYSVSMLSDKASNSEPGLGQMLNSLTDQWRERFATDAWTAVFNATDFSASLQSVQRHAQTLLYRYFQAFNTELETLRREFKSILPSTAPPKFDALNESEEDLLINEAFQQLYSWAINSFQNTIEDCRNRKLLGAKWRDEFSAHMSWKDLNGQVESALQSFLASPDFKGLMSLGSKVSRMQSGFSKESSRFAIKPGIESYSDPAQPPDFQKLRELFLQGHITIKVEPREVATGLE